MFAEETLKYKAESIPEAQEMVRDVRKLLPRGGGSKPALSTPTEGLAALDLAGLRGVLEYEPRELTFTALAGTPLAEIEQVLAERGQYLPFDPLLVERGATLGGTVAAGLSGPGRYHYGGVRDFLLGVRFVNSEGQVVRSGGKVVKNAAGFDFSKLMVGSCGSLGVLVETSFKVFPRPQAYVSLRQMNESLPDALVGLQRAAAARLDLDGLELEPNPDGYVLWVRLGGLRSALEKRLERLKAILGECQVLRDFEEGQVWRQAREFAWVPEGWSLIKVPLTPGRIPAVESYLAGKPVLVRYSAGGQVAWLALKDPPLSMQGLFTEHGLNGLALFGPPGKARLGEARDRPFYQRAKAALDPDHRFVEV